MNRNLLRLIIAVFAVALLVSQGSMGANVVLGQVALNQARVDGSRVPTGTTVLSPSLVQTRGYATAIHLTTGQTLNLAPHSSAYLEAIENGVGVQIAARSGKVDIQQGSGGAFQMTENTVVRLQAEQPGTGEAIKRIKMCRGDQDPVWVDLNEAAIQEGIDKGWGVAGEAPYDEDCNKSNKAGGVVWTKGKIAALVAGGAVAGYVIGRQNEHHREVACQPHSASPVTPGIPFCSSD